MAPPVGRASLQRLMLEVAVDRKLNAWCELTTDGDTEGAHGLEHGSLCPTIRRPSLGDVEPCLTPLAVLRAAVGQTAWPPAPHPGPQAALRRRAGGPWALGGQ